MQDIQTYRFAAVRKHAGEALGGALVALVSLPILAWIAALAGVGA
jgi:hypothetical protein